MKEKDYSIPSTGDRLQAEHHDERIAAERRQGELIARGAEGAWGWRTPAGIIRADRRGRFLIEAAALGPGVVALELGCGTGEFTARLVASECDLTAVDVSEVTTIQ